MEETLEDIVARGEALGRPEGEADLGYFLSPGIVQNVKQNAENVCVLVIHYDFKNARNKNLIRHGDAEDVIHLQKTFQENRKCNFRSISSPKREALLGLLSDQEQLLRLFSSEDDVPSVFVLYILSFGNIDGKICTDHYESEDSENFVSFSTTDIFDSLKNLTLFDYTLKIINFGPCRGEYFDTIYSANQGKFDNENSCRITFEPKMRNLVVFYSTVETTRAVRGKSGTIFAQESCNVINSMSKDEPLVNVFTSIQFQIYQNSKGNYDLDECKYISQTPEIKIFAMKSNFFFSKSQDARSSHSYPTSETAPKNLAAEPEFFTWKSSSKANIRHRRAFLLLAEPNTAVDEIKNALSKNLDFETSERMLNEKESLELYFKEVSELEPDVGCIFTFMFGSVSEHKDTKEVCLRVGDEEITMTSILRNFIGPNNDKWIGKPKIFFLIDQEETCHDSLGSFKISWPKNFEMSATNHSGWLVLVLNSKEKLEMLIEIFKGKELKEGKSLQELLATRLLYSESNDEKLLFNSTLQFLLDFPDFPRSFVRLHFSIESGNFPFLRMYKLNETICLDRIVEIVVSKNLVCLLSSVAGSGKTTVLREIAFQLRKENTELKIVHISLASISNELMKKSHSNEFEFLAESTNRSLEDVNNWISSKKCVVLIDGFDEIYFKYQNKMLRLIESLSKNMVPVMIATRPHKAALIKKAVKNAVILKIEPLKKNQQIEFLKLETGKSEDDCKSFIEKFPKKDILQNPLHLSLVAQSGGRGNLYQIYEQVVRLKVEMCLKNRVGLDATHNQFETESDSAMSFLQRIAFCYLGQAKRFGREGRIEDMEKLNGYGVAMFQNDRIIFLHETFAEFLAARKFVHDVEEANGLFKPSNFFDEEKTIFDDECDFRECWKFVDMYYSTIQRDAQKVNLHKNALLHAVKSNPDAFLEFVVFENLRCMYSMIKSLMTFKKTENCNLIYCRKDSLLLNYVIKNAEDIAVHFVETDMIEGEDPLLKILPNLLKRVAECNATLFFKKLKDKFPILPQLIESKLSRKHRRRAAMEAARLGNEQILDMLLQSGVETDFQDFSGENPLYISCKKGHIECVKVLLNHGAKVAQSGDDSMLYCTPLTVSARFGHLDLVKFLLEGQIDSLQDELEEQWFAFKCAVFEEHTDVAKYLLEKYPTMKNLKVESAESPLHLAVESESLDLCRWIADEAGADLNSLMPIGKPEDADDIYCDFFLMLQSDVNKKDGRGKTALHCAAEYGFLELLRKLINSGANVQEKDINGWNAFHYACENSGRNCYEMIKLLLSEAKEKPVGSCQTGLHIYLRNCDGNEGDVEEIVRFLIEKAGVDVKAVDEDGRTALCIAVERKLRCTDYLMMQGIDVGFKNKKGESRLHLAAKRNDLRVLNVWLDLGGDLNVRDGKESTALHVAIVHESVAFIKRLVELGVDVNAVNKAGETALHIAGKCCYSHAVSFLLDEKAKVNMKDKKGRTAVHHAVQSTDIDLVLELFEHGADFSLTDYKGRNALHYAIAGNSIKNIKIPRKSWDLLWDKKPEDWDFPTTLPYDLTSDSELLNIKCVLNDKVILRLFRCGMCNNLDAKNKFNETALLLACKKKRWNVARFLLSREVDIDIKDNKGKSALHYAKMSNCHEIEKMLIERGTSREDEEPNGFFLLFLIFLIFIMLCSLLILAINTLNVTGVQAASVVK